MVQFADVEAQAYTPYGGARELWRSRAPEILFDGPAGTGKTRSVLEKLNLICMKYRKARVLILRKTRVSMNESILTTFEEKVLPEDSPLLRGPTKQNRKYYLYPTGSRIVCGGLDKASRVLSSDYDVIAVFQAEEINEDEWETLTTRARNGVLPYQQVIADCNPGPPGHWLMKRSLAQRITRVIARHTDNPCIYDPKTGALTVDGEKYLKRLGALTGHRKERLFRGRWVAAEGLVFDEYDEALHLGKRRGPWTRLIIGIDPGFTNPCSMHVYAIDRDSRIHVLAEWYQTKKRRSEIVKQAAEFASLYEVRRLVNGKEETLLEVDAVICDPEDPELIQELEDADLPAMKAECPSVYGSVLTCQEFLGMRGDGRPGFSIDPRCPRMREEFLSWLWKKNADGSARDVPEDRNNHAMSEFRYVAKYVAETSGGGEVFFA